MACLPNQSRNGSDENRWTSLNVDVSTQFYTTAEHIETFPLDTPRKAHRVVLFTILDSFVCFKDPFSYRELSDSTGIEVEANIN